MKQLDSLYEHNQYLFWPQMLVDVVYSIVVFVKDIYTLSKYILFLMRPILWILKDSVNIVHVSFDVIRIFTTIPP